MQKLFGAKIRADEVFFVQPMANLGRRQVSTFLPLPGGSDSGHDLYKRRDLVDRTTFRVWLYTVRHHRGVLRPGVPHRGHSRHLLRGQAGSVEAESKKHDFICKIWASIFSLTASTRGRDTRCEWMGPRITQSNVIITQIYTINCVSGGRLKMFMYLQLPVAAYYITQIRYSSFYDDDSYTIECSYLFWSQDLYDTRGTIK